MTKTIPVIAAVLLLCVFLTGCHPNFPPERERYGKIIGNYPDWARMPFGKGMALSQWFAWQTPETELLRSYIPDSLAIKSKDGNMVQVREYTGYCRIIAERQTFALEFQDGGVCRLFYMFIRGASKYDHESFIDIPQSDQNQFIYSGTLKHGYDGAALGSGECRMQRLEEENGKSHFSYKLTIDGMVVVDEKMYAYQDGWFKERLNPRPQWLPLWLLRKPSDYYKPVLEEWCFSPQQNHFSGFWSFRTDWEIPFPSSYVQDTFMPNTMITMKEISVDGAAKKAVYRLFDGAPGAPQYVELHRDTEATVQFTWFNLPEGQQDAAASRIVLREETLYVQKD